MVHKHVLPSTLANGWLQPALSEVEGGWAVITRPSGFVRRRSIFYCQRGIFGTGCKSRCLAPLVMTNQKADNRQLTTDNFFSPQPKLFPPLGHTLLRLRVHGDLVGPGTGEAFAGPLACGVDAHLGAEVRQARGVVERINRSEGELNVALRVDVVQHLQRDFADVLHVRRLHRRRGCTWSTWPVPAPRCRS